MGKFHTIFSLLVLLIIFQQVLALPTLPLHTNSRWIVDEDGKRVKLACVNWASHILMLAEGLSKQPLDKISKKIASMGFNCVRLTWPTFMVTNETLSSMTARESFQSVNLVESIAGLEVNNPSLVNMTVVQVLQEVVKNLGVNNVMVILDNHVSKPMWCCNKYDGNGFFGDRYFNPRVWLEGLNKIATMFKGVQNVIGMSLRNELRGPGTNIAAWYNFMQKGAEVVHTANPNILVILSGLDFDKDLRMLKNQSQVTVSFKEKLVFEIHWYSFAAPDDWKNGNPNDVCAAQVQVMKDQAYFLLDQGYPLFMGEWGINLAKDDVADNRFASCAFASIAELDLDWAWWSLMGSYYFREHIMALNEFYAILNWDWSEVRNPSFMQRLSSVQSPFRGPGLSDHEQYDVIYHPLTGLCIPKSPEAPPTVPVKLGSCVQPEAWTYTPEKNLQIKDAYYCLQAEGEGKPVKFGTDTDCKSLNAQWKRITNSKFHFSTMVNSTALCLDIDSNNTIVTTQCKCLTGGSCEPASQWFHIIPSTIRYDS